MLNKSLIALVALSTAACTQTGTPGLFSDPLAGSQIEDGRFGAATMNNTLIHSGAAEYRISLARRFDAEVPSTVTFAFDSAVLDENARAALRAQAHWIRQFPEVRFKVYGHTDLVGGRSYNRSLGLRRAQAVVLYLVSQGIGRDRLEAVISEGESQPLIVTEGRERQNRRTVTEVTGFVDSHPMVLNGKYAQIIFRDYVASAVPGPKISSGSISEAASGG